VFEHLPEEDTNKQTDQWMTLRNMFRVSIKSIYQLFKYITITFIHMYIFCRMRLIINMPKCVVAECFEFKAVIREELERKSHKPGHTNKST